MNRRFYWKLICLFLVVCGTADQAFAKHIKGGEIFYKYLGPGTAANSDKYSITLRLFVSCGELQQGQLESEVFIGIFRNVDNVNVVGVPFTFPVVSDTYINLTTPNPCIVNPTAVCYRVRLFTRIVELPKIPQGYSVVFQRCCRIDGIKNVSPNVNVGATYSCQIQGTDALGLTAHNSNPDFGVKDTVLICQKHRFTLNYTATDADGDSLAYEFITGNNGGSKDNAIPNNPQPPSELPNINYASGYSGTKPLGPGVTIDRKTGVISGTAPVSGDYVVCVLVSEYRGGVLLTQHRKDFIVHIDDRCDFPSASLEPSYITCDGFTYNFSNESAATPLVHSYFWDFGVPASTTDTSSVQSPSFTFPDSGTYQVKLIVNQGETCTDSATTLMKVYPGFFPGFTVAGSCFLNPIPFADTTKTRYGVVSNWSWNFGDASTKADTSNQKNPSWKYSDTGTKNIVFIVTSSKGCMDTVNKTIPVTGKPLLQLPFHDTLICSIDTLTLVAKGTGSFSWTPGSSILRSATATPLVYPKTTTPYTVTLNQEGCINTDTIDVRVVDFVTLSAGNDSTICLGDTILLNPRGDALYFSWTPTASLNNPALKNPAATPTANTTYFVEGSIGKCNASASVQILTVPYPLADAGKDTAICFGDDAQLHGSTNGISFYWSPSNTLNSATIIDPKAFPKQTTVYRLYAFDTLGCPKPGIAAVTVNVADSIPVFAGNDTAIVLGEPLQLNASGAPFFTWYPPAGLNKTTISNPIASLRDNSTYIVKAYTAQGCFAYDTIHIKVFFTAPDIFVPNAFTPGKNINALFRPVPVGISSIEYFRVYNRTGSLVYSTSRIGDGWDGIFNGVPQASGGYVWTVQGTDYTGKQITKKGVMALIR